MNYRCFLLAVVCVCSSKNGEASAILEKEGSSQLFLQEQWRQSVDKSLNSREEDFDFSLEKEPLVNSGEGHDDAGSPKRSLQTYADLFVRPGMNVGGGYTSGSRIGGWRWAYAPGRGYVTNFGEVYPLSEYPYQMYPSQPGTINWPLWYHGRHVF